MSIKFSKIIKVFPFILIFIYGCSSGRYSEKKTYTKNLSNSIRVLLKKTSSSINFHVENPISLFSDGKKAAYINRGNIISVQPDHDRIFVKIGSRNFSANTILLKADDSNSTLNFEGKKYRSEIYLSCNNDNINVINKLSLEDYIKGVIPVEMPVNNAEDYFQALKAFAIVVRTYANMKLAEAKENFDVYKDVRDQVYGGRSVEKIISDKAVEETKGLILTYHGNPAKVFYFASCGGYTENAENVFSVGPVPYLRTVKDGDPPNCSIASNFNWTEKYSESEFISRLKNAGKLYSGDYQLYSINVSSRFQSGRVNELDIKLLNKNNDEKAVNLFGNNIRSIIRNSSGNGILKSTMFNIKLNEDKSVTIKGKGNGHGVGLCQWGSIGLAKQGENFKQILQFYFPGTEITRKND